MHTHTQKSKKEKKKKSQNTHLSYIVFEWEIRDHVLNRTAELQQKPSAAVYQLNFQPLDNEEILSVNLVLKM